MIERLGLECMRMIMCLVQLIYMQIGLVHQVSIKLILLVYRVQHDILVMGTQKLHVKYEVIVQHEQLVVLNFLSDILLQERNLHQ